VAGCCEYGDESACSGATVSLSVLNVFVDHKKKTKKIFK
jgi:hypothetical protein